MDTATSWISAAVRRIEPGRLRYTFSRSSGPGGQNVNKVNTKAELRVAVADIEGLTEPALVRLRRLAGQRLTKDDEIIIVSESHRSQIDNRRASLDRLIGLVTEAATIPRRTQETSPDPRDDRAEAAGEAGAERQEEPTTLAAGGLMDHPRISTILCG